MKPLRVLLVTGEYPPQVGGVGDYTALLASQLRAVGLTVGVVTGQSNGAARAEEDIWRVVPDWGVRGWAALRRVLAEFQPDLVHVQYQAGAFAGRGGLIAFVGWLRYWAGVPVVVTFHDRHAPYLFPKAGPIRPLALAALAGLASSTIVTNDADWAAFRQARLRPARLGLIPIGSNIPALPAPEWSLARESTRAALGLGPETLVVAYFGLVGASKGLEQLLDAAAQAVASGNQSLHLLLIGGAASATDQASFGAAGGLAAALARHGLTDCTTITGTLPAATVAGYLAATDLAVLPYRDGASWRRGSLLAALNAGLPVLTTAAPMAATPAGILPDLAAGVALVPANDSGALTTALAQLLHDPAERARLAAAGSALASSFRWEVIAQAHRSWYATTCQSAWEDQG